jgi:penicillin-binding protein 2
MARGRDMLTVYPWRLAILAVAMLAVWGLLPWRLWNLQVRQGSEKRAQLARQSLRSIRVAGVRGRLLDRNGVPLAENRPSYCLSLYLEDLRKPGRRQNTIDAVMDTLDRLAETMDRPRRLDAKDVATHLNRRTPLALTAWRDLDPVAVARFMEHAEEFPGVDLTVEPVRVYPGGSLAAHVLGYVGRADEETLAESGLEEERLARVEEGGEEEDERNPFHYYLPEMVGRSGLEKSLDEELRAASGGRLEIQVDVAGFRYQVVSNACREAGKGSDVRLSLDTRVQRAAEEALSGVRGAAVVVDPRNGDVLAMASAPAFNPNDFVPSIPRATWAALQTESRPLVNRAAAGEYAPGSTFKPITLLAAMRSGKVRPDTRYTCGGAFQLGTAKFRCAQTWGHGSIDLAQAIRYSCNVYLFHAGLACGPEIIQETARAFGLGAKTGIELDYERAGLIPDDRWKRTARGEGWRDGDTCNMSIGQGAVLVTPLQLAMYTAALANGGTLWRPRLVLGETRGGETKVRPARRARDLRGLATAEQWAAVRKGMRDVVQAPDGSGRLARVEGMELAAKTGTAEYGAKGSGKKMTWMIAYGPAAAPKYAAAFLVEDGASGGRTVSPLVRKFFQRVMADVEGRGGPGGDGEEAAG